MQKNDFSSSDCAHQSRIKPAYSIAQAAVLLNVSDRTLWRMIARGKIRSVKVSERRRVITERELQRLLEAG